jgi:hypothetical protein
MSTDKVKKAKDSLLKSRTKVLFINVIVFLTLFELASRSYLSLRRNADFTNPSSTVLFYYPEMKPTMEKGTSPEEWDVLLLGASVLNPAWGSVEKEIKTLLSESISDSVRIHNLSMPSHTTRDSLLKYRLLKDKRFDKVFVYHGINEIRMNNYPEEHYRSDYSHIHWYRTVTPLVRHRELRYWATPFMFEHAWFKITTEDDDEEHEDRKYGAIIKTETAFASNLSAIAELAKERGENLVLATYAFHLPGNYSKETFLAHKLDYDKHRLPVEAWGYSENVGKNLRSHNRIIRQVAKSHSLPCLGVAELIPKNGANFDDICHLTATGSQLFAEAAAPLLQP